MRPDILLWDDDLDFSTELARALQSRGFATRIVSSICDISTLAVPTVLLLDLCMPKQDGIEALVLLSRHTQKHLLKIMFVSGWDEGMVERAAKLGIFHGLDILPAHRKPVAVGVLCAALDALN